MTPTDKHPGRNDPCPCGSGRKYKQCCLKKDEDAERKARAAASEKAAEATEAGSKDRPRAGKEEDRDAGSRRGGETAHQHPHGRSEQPWRKSPGGAHPTQRRSMSRKIGSK